MSRDYSQYPLTDDERAKCRADIFRPLVWIGMGAGKFGRYDLWAGVEILRHERFKFDESFASLLKPSRYVRIVGIHTRFEPPLLDWFLRSIVKVEESPGFDFDATDDELMAWAAVARRSKTAKFDGYTSVIEAKPALVWFGGEMYAVTPEQEKMVFQFPEQKIVYDISVTAGMRVEISSPHETLKDLYRRLVRDFHPDRAKSPYQEQKFTRIMQDVNAAYKAQDRGALEEIDRAFLPSEPKPIDFAYKERVILIKRGLSICRFPRSELHNSEFLAMMAARVDMQAEDFVLSAKSQEVIRDQ